MEPIDIEVLRRLREYRSCMTMDELSTVLGGPGRDDHGLLHDAVKRLSNQDLHLVEVQDCSVQLTLAGCLLAGYL